MAQQLGKFLIERRLIRQDQLDTALREQRRSRRFLGEILLAFGFAKREDFYPLLAEFMGFPFIDLSVCTDYFCHPQGWVEIKAPSDDGLHIVVADPHDLFIQHSLALAYPDQNPILYLADPRTMEQLSHSQPLASSSQDYAPDLLRQLISRALEARASDVHFLPALHHCQVLLRLDGLLVPLQTLHRDQWQALCAHIKVLGHLDLAEARRPQDGSFRFYQGSDPIDCRLSTMPTKDGESIVIRLLDPRSVQTGLDQLGLLTHQVAKLKNIARSSEGLFIITGPTGSGKTTTLYSMLQEIIPAGRNIMTVEQPIEYRLEGVRQTEIQEEVTDFAKALRSILRHDPDVIYVSEIRDAETAMTAVRAAMTGHLVLTTLHVSDVRLIPRRLEDLGVPTGYLSGVLKGAMAQRLIRRSCVECSGKGCQSCFETGYRGRHVVAEIFTQGDDLETQYLTETNERMVRYARDLIGHQTNRHEVDRVFGPVEPRAANAA
ncbi:GspE/PulE family protein [Candidatus Odyssella acanthamoebae]|uniref:GspE/PulE family protein n=1 Tax=Candidatus Odyssella acanthamoebae TaxID=91604 RepID=UPI00068CA909|nr:GspE/PulE family protein [Candidatus Paracaedibacter acanthamoebae]